jgi:hypothetical protein
LTGRPPTPTLERVSGETLTPLGNLVREPNEALANLINRCLELDPLLRPQNARGTGLIGTSSGPLDDDRTVVGNTFGGSQPTYQPTVGVNPTVVKSPATGRKKWIASATVALAIVGGLGVAAVVASEGNTPEKQASANLKRNSNDPVVITTTVALVADTSTTVLTGSSAAKTTAPIPFSMERAVTGLLYESGNPRSVATSQAVRAAYKLFGTDTPEVFECDVDASNECASQLLAAGDLIGVISTVSSDATAKLTALSSKGVPLLLVGPTRLNLSVPRVSPSTFRLSPNDFSIGRESGAFAKSKGGRRLFQLTPNTLSVLDQATAEAAMAGFESAFGPSTITSNEELPVSSDFDTVFANGVSGEAAESAVQELKRRKWKGIVIGSSELFSLSFTGSACGTKNIRCFALDQGILDPLPELQKALKEAGSPPAVRGSLTPLGFDSFVVWKKCVSDLAITPTLQEFRDSVSNSLQTSLFTTSSDFVYKWVFSIGRGGFVLNDC